MLLSSFVPPRGKVAAVFIAATLCCQGCVTTQAQSSGAGIAPEEKPKNGPPAKSSSAAAADKPAKPAAAPADAKPVFTNHLANSKSPYLLQHQHNPVDWYPWGEEAFEKAKKEDKPIFLSIGYSTCHYCHLMAHESFEDEEIAKVLNENFVSIKVDREVQKDVDDLYQTFVHTLTGSGGWPVNAFLTPDRKPFHGVGYLRPSSFKSLLGTVAGGWKSERAGLVEHSEKMLAKLQKSVAGAAGTSPLNEGLYVAALPLFARSYDEKLGGFVDVQNDGDQKFPRPVRLNFLFRFSARESLAAADREQAKKMALDTLDKMAGGGIHDHLGGGFHRYSVDKYWHVPHFEKMLYDQAQLASSYLDAYQVTHDAAYEKVARDILDYVRRDMTDKAGGFHSAEDADSLETADAAKPTEGAYYVWTKAEIDKVLGEGAALFEQVYGVEEEGNAPRGSDKAGELKGKNTLIVRMPVAEAAKAAGKPEAEVAKSLADSRKKLFEARAKRPRPHLDDKIITAWNGLMISAYARGAQILGDAAYLKAAQNAAKFLRAELWKDGELRRAYRQGAGSEKGFASDYAFLIQGLLDLYEADFDIAWVQWAIELQAKMDALYDDASGGYFNTTAADKNVLLRMKESVDKEEPAPTSVAAMNLLRLAEIAGDPKMAAHAEKEIASLGGQMAANPAYMGQMLCALDAHLQGLRHVAIIGKAGAVDTKALLAVARERYVPGKIVLLLDGGPGQKWLVPRHDYLKTAAPRNGNEAYATVCDGAGKPSPVCRDAYDPEKLRELLKEP